MDEDFSQRSWSKNNDWWSEVSLFYFLFHFLKFNPIFHVLDSLSRFQNDKLEGGEHWRDIESNIVKMDSLYDATFHSWLKNEENVVIVSSYLHRIANEYPLDRIINSLKWLISSWKLESVTMVIRKVTADWSYVKQDVGLEGLKDRFFDPLNHAKVIEGETRRGILVRELTRDWPCIQVARLVSNLSAVFWRHKVYQEVFLKALVLDWDFCRLSEFFSYIGAHLGLSYSLKISMLQLAAKRNGKIDKKEVITKDVQKRVGQDNIETDGAKRARLNPDIGCIEGTPITNIQGLPYMNSDQEPEMNEVVQNISNVSQTAASSPNPSLDSSQLTCQRPMNSEMNHFDISDQQHSITIEISLRESTSSNNLSLI
ncbi:hypothetical protein AYI68_g7220 [Smittium mucronatum]|uniref:Uncharacterized protein n=1 Tax=Smittium mucronatum TaxID=133383 RepID=A0A1R0GP99_9FUNG|nr:hypothetical protein AYI68_g7220 [Smittium mucronatum]